MVSQPHLAGFLNFAEGKESGKVDTKVEAGNEGEDGCHIWQTPRFLQAQHLQVPQEA